MFRPSVKFFALTLLLLTLAAPLSACKDQAHAEEEAAAAPPAGPHVVAANPLVKEVDEWEEFTGRFEAVAKVEIRSRVSGYLDKIAFIDGQTVKEGDTLFVIDPRPFQAALREAEAQLKSAQNRLTLAGKELQRSDELAKQGYATKQNLDIKTEGKQSAAADLDAARARVEQARLDLEYTTVKAPISGRVSRHMVDVGNLVTGGAQGATMLTTIVTQNPIHFYFDIDEQTYLKYARITSTGIKSGNEQINKPVQVALSDSKDYEFQGVMDFVDTTLNTQTGTVRGRATFENSDFTLTPGLFGRARILGAGKQTATLIPDEAVGIDQSRSYVLTLGENNMVVSKTVKLGPMADGLRIVREGLTAQDKVIIKGVQMLRDGMPVTPEMTTLQVKAEPQFATVPAAATATAEGQ